MTSAGLVGSRPLNLHTGGPAPLWCFRCGVLNKPERAIGTDEDGEPACALHRMKQAAEIFANKVSNRIAQELWPDKVEPAKPSPPQATEQEKAAMGGVRSETLTPDQLKHASELKRAGVSGAAMAKQVGVAYWRIAQSDALRAVEAGRKSATVAPKKPKQRPKGRLHGFNEPTITLKLGQSRAALLIELLLDEAVGSRLK